MIRFVLFEFFLGGGEDRVSLYSPASLLSSSSDPCIFRIQVCPSLLSRIMRLEYLVSSLLT